MRRKGDGAAAARAAHLITNAVGHIEPGDILKSHAHAGRLFARQDIFAEVGFGKDAVLLGQVARGFRFRDTDTGIRRRADEGTECAAQPAGYPFSVAAPETLDAAAVPEQCNRCAVLPEHAQATCVLDAFFGGRCARRRRLFGEAR